MPRWCRTGGTGRKRLGKRAKPPLRPASLETGQVAGENVCLSGKTGSDRRRFKTTLLTKCMVRPCVARGFVELVSAGLASMYPASDWSMCSGPSWISARMRSHYRTGLNGPFGSPGFACAGKTDPPSSSHPLADSCGEGIDYVIDSLLDLCSSFVRAH